MEHSGDRHRNHSMNSRFKAWRHPLIATLPLLAIAADNATLTTARAVFAPLPASADSHATNKLNPAKVALGKQLYFDARLSKGGYGQL